MSTINDTSSPGYIEQARYDAAETERARAQESHQAEIKGIREDYDYDRKQASEEYNSKLLQEKKDAQEDVKKLKEDLYTNEGKKYSKDTRDLSDQRAQLASYREEIIKEYTDKTDKMEAEFQRRAKDGEMRKEDRIQATMKEHNRSHQIEVKHLDDALRQASVDPRDLEKEKAVAHAQAIRDVEGPAKRDKEYLVRSYESSIDKLKERAEADRSNSGKRLTEVQYDTLGKANIMLREQRKDFIKRDQDRLSEMKHVEGEFKREMSNERSKSERGTEVLRINHENQTKDAMQNQAQAINNHYGTKKAGYEYEIGKQGEEIKLLKSTDNALLASPALVNKIQRSEEKRYNNQLVAEHNHFKNQEIGLAEKDNKVRREMLESHQKEIAAAHRQGTHKLDVEKTMLLTGYEDLKSSKDHQVTQMKDSHATLRERTQMRHAQEVELLQRKNMESMNIERDNFIDENRKSLGETEFKNRVQNRELAAKMTEFRRDADNKLANLELNHELQMNELHLSHDAKLREQERTFKKVLDERVTGYEHRIKEQELAYKDRERYLKERSEEEIDKMKRTNARIIEKKS